MLKKGKILEETKLLNNLNEFNVKADLINNNSKMKVKKSLIKIKNITKTKTSNDKLKIIKVEETKKTITIDLNTPKKYNINEKKVVSNSKFNNKDFKESFNLPNLKLDNEIFNSVKYFFKC